MSLATMLRALKRGSDSEEKALHADRHGNLYVSKGMPDYADLVRQNKVWTLGQATATAAVIGSTYPTTACQLLMYNNESEGSGKSYMIITVGAVQIGAGAALAAWNIIYGVTQIKQTTLPTGDITIASARPMRGNGGAYPGRALFDLAPTLDVDPLYKPLPVHTGHASNPVNSLAGPALSFPINGLIILPPSSGLALHVVAADVGVTTRLNVVWAEEYLDLP